MKLFIPIIVLVTLLACNTTSDQKGTEVNFKADKKEKDNINSTEAPQKLKVAIASMISPKETFTYYKELIQFIGEKIKLPYEFKQRKTYGEVNEMLGRGDLDFAFICTGAYTELRKKYPVEIIALPVVNGKPTYNAYIITHKDLGIEKFSQLRGKSFAFTDPYSNTGYNYTIKMLKDNGLDKDAYFSKTVFTYAHDYSIQAVARKIVDGASIDGLVFEFLRKKYPEKVKDISIIHVSKDFAIPPFVINSKLDRQIKRGIKNTLLSMHESKDGQAILEKIGIDKFVEGRDELYDSVREIMKGNRY